MSDGGTIGTIHRINNERVDQVRDLVWRLKSGVHENEARVIAIADYLAGARHRTSELQKAGKIAQLDKNPEVQSAALDLTLQELAVSHEELRVADEELRSRSEALAKWERDISVKLGLHRRLFEHAPMAFFATDKFGVIVDANCAATQLLNVPIRFLSGKPIINFVTRGDVRRMRSFIQSIHKDSDVLHSSMQFRPRNGKGVVPSVVRAGAIEIDGELVIGWLVRDIEPARVQSPSADAFASEPSSSAVVSRPSASPASWGGDGSDEAADLRGRQEQQQQQEHDGALAIIAHELRAPLQTIETAIALLDTTLLHHPDFEYARRHCAHISRSTRAMARLIADLKDAASLGEGRMTLETTRCELRGLVDDAIDAIQARAESAGATVFLETSEDEPILLEADALRLAQVLSNLLDNAIKFSTGGADTTVDVRVSVADGTARVTVTDHGVGIAPDDIPHVFERRWQSARNTSAPAAAKGSGLGLWICDSIVRLHGGTMGVSSKQGVGSSVWFELPRS